MTDPSPDAHGPEALLARVRHAARQEQFLDLVSAEEALRRFRAALPPGRLGAELVPLAASLGRIVAQTLPARADAPPFDRASVDG
ncbi:MAG: molybdopterin biosynthesis protein, partial [Alphaproteobacteria bacterium]